MAEWRAYARITGPLGLRRGDVQAGVVAQTIAAVNRRKGSSVPKLDNFVLDWDTGKAVFDYGGEDVDAEYSG